MGGRLAERGEEKDITGKKGLGGADRLA